MSTWHTLTTDQFIEAARNMEHAMPHSSSREILSELLNRLDQKAEQLKINCDVIELLRDSRNTALARLRALQTAWDMIPHTVAAEKVAADWHGSKYADLLDMATEFDVASGIMVYKAGGGWHIQLGITNRLEIYDSVEHAIAWLLANGHLKPEPTEVSVDTIGG